MVGVFTLVLVMGILVIVLVGVCVGTLVQDSRRRGDVVLLMIVVVIVVIRVVLLRG